ncbi:hypothetical protein J4207_00685 [Candidatus Woesearchaeota archaeon]|nr:hypothetical protein [Candidatus Woesearchaeota archaeon]
MTSTNPVEANESPELHNPEKTETRETLERIAEAAKLEDPQAAARNVRAKSNSLSDTVFGLITGSCAAVYGAYATLANTELLTNNTKEIRWEPSFTGFGTVAGTALAASGVAYFIPKAARKVREWLVNLPKTDSRRRKISNGLWTASIVTALGSVIGLTSLTKYAMDGKPTFLGIPGKRIAAALAEFPSDEYCTLLRNSRYLSDIPQNGFYVSGVTVTGRVFQGRVLIDENQAFERLAHCDISTGVDEIMKGHHNIQDKHAPHPESDRGLVLIQNHDSHMPPYVVSGKKPSLEDYVTLPGTELKSYKTQHVRIKDLVVQTAISPTSTTLQPIFGEPISEAVIEMTTSERNYVSISTIMNDLPEVPKGNYLVYATPINGKIRLRARAEDGAEHDISRFASDAKINDWMRQKLKNFLTTAEQLYDKGKNAK